MASDRVEEWVYVPDASRSEALTMRTLMPVISTAMIATTMIMEAP